jgi:hypothetical protein
MELFREVPSDESAQLLLDRELVISVTCPMCNRENKIIRPRTDVSMREGMCPKCQVVMTVQMDHVVDAGSDLAEKTLKELGVPLNDIVRVKQDGKVHHLRLAADRSDLVVRGPSEE